MKTVYIFFIISRWFLLRMINFQAKVVEKIETHVSCSVTPPPEYRAVYEKMWKNIVEWGRPQMAIWRMRIVCWITKATNTLTQVV